MEQTEERFPETIPELVSFRALEYDTVYSRKEHSPGHHELLYVLDGRMTLHLGEKLIFHAGPGDFLLVPAGTPHRDEFAPLKGLRILLIHFDWEEKEYFRRVHNLALAKLSPETRDEARRRLDFLRDRRRDTELRRRNASFELHGILMLFYFDIMDNVPGENRVLPQEPAAEIMRRVKHYLDRNFSSQVTLKDAAAFAGLSPSYLSRRFRREYGVGFAAYLTARRLEAARRLLQDTSLQIGEIALRCGFSSGSYFIRVYTGHWGVTPKNHTPRRTKFQGNA